MGTPRLSPRQLLANPGRFGRAGADWTGWQTRTLDQGNRPVDQDVAAAVAWTQHHLAVRVRRHFGYPSADDADVDDQYAKADAAWSKTIAAAKRADAFARHCGVTKGVLVDKLSGRTLADHADLHQWAHEAGTTVAAVLKKVGPLPSR